MASSLGPRPSVQLVAQLVAACSRAGQGPWRGWQRAVSQRCGTGRGRGNRCFCRSRCASRARAQHTRRDSGRPVSLLYIAQQRTHAAAGATGQMLPPPAPTPIIPIAFTHLSQAGVSPRITAVHSQCPNTLPPSTDTPPRNLHRQRPLRRFWPSRRIPREESDLPQTADPRRFVAAQLLRDRRHAQLARHTGCQPHRQNPPEPDVRFRCSTGRPGPVISSQGHH